MKKSGISRTLLLFGFGILLTGVVFSKFFSFFALAAIICLIASEITDKQMIKAIKISNISFEIGVLILIILDHFILSGYEFYIGLVIVFLISRCINTYVSKRLSVK